VALLIAGNSGIKIKEVNIQKSYACNQWSVSPSQALG
jgi:hypothetical protein